MPSEPFCFSRKSGNEENNEEEHLWIPAKKQDKVKNKASDAFA